MIEGGVTRIAGEELVRDRVIGPLLGLAAYSMGWKLSMVSLDA